MFVSSPGLSSSAGVMAAGGRSRMGNLSAAKAGPCQDGVLALPLPPQWASSWAIHLDGALTLLLLRLCPG